jgi:hypothetical protein
MSRTRGAVLVVSAGLMGVAGCATTARPMLFHRNHTEAPCLPEAGIPVGEGPILTEGVPVTPVPGMVIPPGAVTPPPGTILPPAAGAAPAVPVPPLNASPPVGPPPRTTPTPSTNGTQFQPNKSTKQP